MASEAGRLISPMTLRRLSPLTLQLDKDGSLLWYVPVFGGHAYASAAAAADGEGVDAAGGGGREETAAGMMSALEACLLQSQVGRMRPGRVRLLPTRVCSPNACMILIEGVEAAEIALCARYARTLPGLTRTRNNTRGLGQRQGREQVAAEGGLSRFRPCAGMCGHTQTHTQTKLCTLASA